MAYQLAHAGFQVCTASTGREALRALDSEAPDLVVLDLMLPEVSGTEILRTMRSRRETKDTPVIILTARTAGSCCASRAHSRVTLRGTPAPSWRRATIVFSNLPLGARLSHL